MTEKSISLLSDTYKNWDFVKKSTTIWEITNNHQEAGKEITVILDALIDILEKERVTITIEESVKPKIVVKANAKKKHNKMYTSGCFDIFHYGHLNILKKSKELCNYLIVGVSTDELIEKEKGKRPVIPFNERVKVIESIKYVDQVIPQTDKNKQKIVDEYEIDAISVGDDWKGRYPKVTCAMEYFPYTASVSSTILKEALKLTEKQNI